MALVIRAFRATMARPLMTGRQGGGLRGSDLFDIYPTYPTFIRRFSDKEVPGRGRVLGGVTI